MDAPKVSKQDLLKALGRGPGGGDKKSSQRYFSLVLSVLCFSFRIARAQTHISCKKSPAPKPYCQHFLRYFILFFYFSPYGVTYESGLSK